MAVQGPFKVACEEVFPHGVGVVGAVAPMADFDASTRENRLQARDKDTGLPVWVVDVIDFDPQARERTFKSRSPPTLSRWCLRWWRGPRSVRWCWRG